MNDLKVGLLDQIIVVIGGSTDHTIDVVQSDGDRLTLINKANGGNRARFIWA